MPFPAIRPLRNRLGRRPWRGREIWPAEPASRVLLTAVAAGTVATVWMWFHDLSAPHSAADWITDAGRLTGLLGGYGLGVLIFLMSRAPWLERRIGAGELAGWHALGGPYVLSLIAAHTLLIIWGYAGSTKTALTTETSDLLVHYADVLAATVGLGFLVVVWVVSMRAIRRRVSYEAWFHLHLYTYLGAALAFAHEFSVGADFTAQLLARIVWAAFYVLVTVVLLWYRFAVPVWAAFRYRLRVTRVRRESPLVTTLYIGGNHLDQLRAEPGQFFRWRFLTRDGWWQSHPFSLSANPGRSHIRLTVKAAGDFTRTLQRIHPGVRVMAEGPYGALTPAVRTRQDVLLLAGGIGITPLRALLDVLARDEGEVILLYRANVQDELVFRAELEHIRNTYGADIRYLVGPPGSAADVLVGDRLTLEIPDISERDVFATGPPGFTDAALAALSRADVPRRQIHVERFAL